MKSVNSIVVVGLGLIGGSIAKALTRRAGISVLGIDKNPEVIRKALECGAIAAQCDLSGLEEADFIYLCTYPQAAVDFITENGPRLKKGCIVTDACGIKSAVCPALTALSAKHGFVFVGGHPMAGKEQNGFDYSEADLFDGASYILVPCGAPQQAVDAVGELALQMGFGATVIATPEHHDEMIAYTSQVPHALACSYVLSPRCAQHRGYSAGSYRDVSRVAKINETLWSELFLDNREALVRELDTLMENMGAIRNAVADGDREALTELLRQGRIAKESAG